MKNRETERLFAYYEASKHTVDSIRRSRHTLDWANMPDPFRHYEGVPVLDLPADPPCPEIPALAVLGGRYGSGDRRDGGRWLSQLLYYSAAISATKRTASGYRYSLRVNPSSGNLHPTEFHFATQGVTGWPDGLYHYRPSAHMAEQRARGQYIARLAPGLEGVPILFVLTSIAWREAWKYRDRAYRYCLLDAGHAWQALVLAAAAIGAEAFAIGHFADERIAEELGITDEWPMLLVALRGPGIPVSQVHPGEQRWLGGAPNRLSAEELRYPLIDAIHESGKLENPAGGQARLPFSELAEFLERPFSQILTRSFVTVTGTAAAASAPFGLVARRRRSALDFQGGSRAMPRADLETILRAATTPLAADFPSDLIELYAYVHRVGGLQPGVYRYSRSAARLELVKAGDQRLMAAGLSLGQDLAGNACVAFSMIAGLERAAEICGNRGYRLVLFHAGGIGQRLYLAAEASGLQSTGIGAFYDDEVHCYLGTGAPASQVVYHFACGYGVRDERLSD